MKTLWRKLLYTTMLFSVARLLCPTETPDPGHVRGQTMLDKWAKATPKDKPILAKAFFKKTGIPIGHVDFLSKLLVTETKAIESRLEQRLKELSSHKQTVMVENESGQKISAITKYKGVLSKEKTSIVNLRKRYLTDINHWMSQTEAALLGKFNTQAWFDEIKRRLPEFVRLYNNAVTEALEKGVKISLGWQSISDAKKEELKLEKLKPESRYVFSHKKEPFDPERKIAKGRTPTKAALEEQNKRFDRLPKPNRMQQTRLTEPLVSVEGRTKFGWERNKVLDLFKKASRGESKEQTVKLATETLLAEIKKYWNEYKTEVPIARAGAPAPRPPLRVPVSTRVMPPSVPRRYPAAAAAA